MERTCPNCGAQALHDLPFTDHLGEMGKTLLNPVELPLAVVRASSYVFRRLFSDDEFASYTGTRKCPSCQCYATTCPHCDRTFKLASIPKLQTVLTCPHCTRKIHYDLPS